MGRPPKRAVAAKKQLHLRVTEAELEVLHAAAGSEGRQLSEWALDLLMRRAKRLGFVPQEPPSSG